jgi:beta-glucosidase
MNVTFPPDFVWGVGTSAYQIEGATAEGGRGPSIWDRFCQIPGKVHDGATADVAIDHYNRYEGDLDLLRDLGLRHYRFSISWPRWFPSAGGRLNQGGADFYSRLVDAMLARGIEPWATLYHWDLPLWLEDQGGWLKRDTARYFADYSEAVVRKLGDRVKRWWTINEPSIIMFLGYITGEFAPGMKSWNDALRVAHHLLLAHGRALTAIRQTAPDSQAGIVLHLLQVERLSRSPFAYAGSWFWWTLGAKWFIEPLLCGRYPVPGRVLYNTLLPVIHDGDMGIISQPADYLGINYYLRQAIAASGRWIKTVPGSEHTAMGWEVNAGALERLLLRLKVDYPTLPPLYLSEFGAAFEDTVANGQINDPRRIQYTGDHLYSCARAIARDVNLKGAFYWTPFDNFEWNKGYSHLSRFGLFHVDRRTLERTPKASAYWYGEVARRNGFDWPIAA